MAEYDGIYAKQAEMQFWGTTQNPGPWLGTAFHIDCCPCDCIVFPDDFFRIVATTDLGNTWNEIKGDWGSDGSMLVETFGLPSATEDALLMCRVGVTNYRDNGMHVAVSIDNSITQVGDIHHLHVCCDEEDDTGGGIDVTFEKTGANEWTTTIPGGGADGIAVQTPVPYPCLDAVPGDCVRIWVCADNMANMVKAGVSSLSEPYAWCDSMNPGDGRYAGIEHEQSAVQQVYDDWVISDIRIPDEVCDDCFCWCLRWPPKRRLTATISPAINRATCLGGLTWDMDWIWAVGDEHWYGIAKFPRYDSGTQDVAFKLMCDNGDDDDEDWPGKNFGLWTLAAYQVCCNTNPGGCDVVWTPLQSSTCHPLNLVFGPFWLASSELTCLACYAPLDPTPEECEAGDPNCVGYYYITITE